MIKNHYYCDACGAQMTENFFEVRITRSIDHTYRNLHLCNWVCFVKYAQEKLQPGERI